MKVIHPGEGSYPSCPVCYGPLRRPCEVWESQEKHTTICGGCYRLLMILGRMERKGWLIPEAPLTYGLPNVNGGDESASYKGVLKENDTP